MMNTRRGVLMIFYFTATGNSLYTAEKLAEATNESLVSVGKAFRDELYEYDIRHEEYLGFIVPTFAGTLPGAVGLFLERLTLKGYSNQFVYGVFTCGESSGFESAALYTMLKAKGVSFAGSFELVMPDNFIVWANVPSPTKLDTILKNADKRLDEIVASIKAKKSGKLDTAIPGDLYMKLREFSTSKKTSELHADEKCTSCGLCVEMCPMRCIKSDNSGRPLWEGTCTMCFACLHRCPANAVQYGNDTQNKGRYINPKVTL
jgi:NAD-dependent dihydropyrimidine dehydrogenase PreA subunit/flavodoxin